MDIAAVKMRRLAPLRTPTQLSGEAAHEIAGALSGVLAVQLFAATDPLAERARKIGGTTLRTIGQVGARQPILDNDADDVSPQDMLAALRDDNRQLAAAMRETHGLCDSVGDVASASLLDGWIDEAEQRLWFLFEAGRQHGANA